MDSPIRIIIESQDDLVAAKLYAEDDGVVHELAEHLPDRATRLAVSPEDALAFGSKLAEFAGFIMSAASQEINEQRKRTREILLEREAAQND